MKLQLIQDQETFYCLLNQMLRFYICLNCNDTLYHYILHDGSNIVNKIENEMFILKTSFCVFLIGSYIFKKKSVDAKHNCDLV